MSVVDIRAAMIAPLKAMSPTLDIARENVTYTPVAGTPYQAVFMQYGTPDGSLIGQKTAEIGFMQVELKYPVNGGPGAAEARAEAIRAIFYRGASFTSGSTTVTVTNKPQILPGYDDADRYIVPVRVPFTTNFG